MASLLRCHTLVDLSDTKVLTLLSIRDPNKHFGSQTYNKIGQSLHVVKASGMHKMVLWLLSESVVPNTLISLCLKMQDMHTINYNGHTSLSILFKVLCCLDQCL